tara:strand:+ start:7272 stop:9356 length:2085 start_codon:yes stop_codon:yes gene_type:complete
MSQRQRGFVDRRSALQAVRLPAEMSGGPLPYVTQQVMARGQSWIVLTPEGGIPARSNYDPGRALCDSYFVDENPSPPALLEETNQDAATLNQYVYNLSTEAVAGNEYFIAVQVGNVLVVSSGGGGGEGGGKRIQFRSTTKMLNGQINGEVILIEGATGFSIGDVVTFSDPFNLFMDAEPYAIGWAYLRKTTDECEVQRWEVEEISLPINRVTAFTTECLKKTDILFQALVSINNGTDMLSGYHNVDLPPDLDGASSVYVENPYKLDTCGAHAITIERRPDLIPSTPTNCYVPSGTSSSNFSWILVQVEEQIARWITVIASVNGSVVTWSYDGLYWDGCNPFAGDCQTPEIETLCEVGCIKDGACGIACYRPELHRYVVVSTSSALMGLPETKTIVTKLEDAGELYPCQMEMTTQEVCLVTKEEPVVGFVQFSTMEVDVVTDATSFGSFLQFNKSTITTCSVTAAAADLVDICPLLCLCDQFYECCSAQCGCDESECTWDWDSEAWEWINTIPCPEGCECTGGPPPTPGGNDPTTVSYPCEDSDACCDSLGPTTAVTLVNFEFMSTSNFDTTVGTLIAGSSVFSAAGDCGATLTFNIGWTNLTCGQSQITAATAVLKKNATCCYWEVTLISPTAACLGQGTLADGWPGNTILVPNCGGETSLDCSTFAGTDCAPVCSDGGFDFPTFVITNAGQCQ